MLIPGHRDDLRAVGKPIAALSERPVEVGRQTSDKGQYALFL